MSDDSRGFFFVFQPRVGEPVKEITIWFNGGPGCSSLEGFFQENGRIQWSWGQYSPQINPYSWVNLTNMLWVEYPVGVGFSPGNATAIDEEEPAAEFVQFFKNFQNIFNISNHNIYVTGESYAGRYVPYVANAMLDQNDTKHFNVSGALVYDPCIGSFEYANAISVYPFIEQYNNILGFNKSFVSLLAQRDKQCGYAQFRQDYMHFPPNGTQPPLYLNTTADPDCDLWDAVYDNAYGVNPCFNVYEPNLQCPLLSDPLGFPSDLIYSYPGLPPYFNRTDVKKAMHAPLTTDWELCTGPVFVADGGPEGYGDLSPDPLQGVLPRVIEATNRVLISNGALDLEVLTNGTMLAIQNMTWHGKLGFQTAPATPIVIKIPDIQYADVFVSSGFDGLDAYQGVMGVQHYERGLMWAETYLSGHMQPQFQPRSSFRHLQWLLGRIDAL
ncbi:carboxypeptidase D [Capronia epimyces CBS 606.96]|uniref:Carboxypeptidase n=1 Tax=Capronia epimyces CBS 606.96 TaxID=1182542 RepID=W9XKB9_9EURO|nr:carboxypeptidase D [Capronia epimyces CBS 606.96]EXJ80947.1 carboxypeptidase D [Capronia epimyces CBS 606.96]